MIRRLLALLTADNVGLVRHGGEVSTWVPYRMGDVDYIRRYVELHEEFVMLMPGTLGHPQTIWERVA